MSAIFVKMPPPMRKRGAERFADGKADEARPGKFGGMKARMPIIQASSTQMSSRPMLMPACSGMKRVFSGLPRKAANEVRELAIVLIRMPNQATP